MSVQLRLKNFAENLPVFIGYPLTSVPFALRLGPAYQKMQKEVVSTESNDLATPNSQLIKQMRSLFSYLYEMVKFHYEFYNHKNFFIDKFGFLAGLERVPFVNNLGYLTHVNSLAQYLANDVVVTFYDPAIRINRFALPNKWGDAIVMGTPIILNEGIKTAAPLITAGVAFTVPFDSPDSLVVLLRDLQRDGNRLSAAKTAIANIKNNYKPFDESIVPVMNTFLGNH